MELAERIREGYAEIRGLEKDYDAIGLSRFQCYFCNKPINGRIRIAVLKDERCNTYYPIDSKCYYKAIGFTLIK
ncbi:MAG: hypothetical protein QXK37_01620 [Candidatus Woesearchaeota archaeon]